MDWLNRMNRAMDYIEANLDGEISCVKAAQIACCSTYNFQRMFSFITETSLSEYIRRRRLTLAAVELQTTGAKVIGVALKYGYESPEAFSRAFKALHGAPPSQIRGNGVNITVYPRMTFTLSVKGDIGISYRIEKTEAFGVFGIYEVIGDEMESAFAEIEEFRDKCERNGAAARINELTGNPRNAPLHSVLFDFGNNKSKFMFCRRVTEGSAIPEGFARLEIPKATYAVFSSGDGNIRDFYRRVYTEWFAITDYDLSDSPRLELRYDDRTELWLPVVIVR